MKEKLIEFINELMHHAHFGYEFWMDEDDIKDLDEILNEGENEMEGKRVITVEYYNGTAQSFVVDWGAKDKLPHIIDGEWLTLGDWKMVKASEVKSVQLLPEEEVKTARDEFIENMKPKKPGRTFIERAMKNIEKEKPFIHIINEAFEEDKMHYGWDFGKIQELKREQDKQQEERERPAKERKERELDSLVNITDEVFGFIRKYNTERIHDLKRHNELYDEIVRELERANRHKHTKG